MSEVERLEGELEQAKEAEEDAFQEALAARWETVKEELWNGEFKEREQEAYNQLEEQLREERKS